MTGWIANLLVSPGVCGVSTKVSVCEGSLVGPREIEVTKAVFVYPAESSRTVMALADKVKEGMSSTELTVSVIALLLVTAPSLAKSVSVAAPLAFAVGKKES